MSPFNQERTCSACGQTFKLSDHAITGAQAVGEALASGLVTEEDAPDLVRTCPRCLGTEQMDEAEAQAELFRLEHATERARERHIPRDVKTYASGLAFSGMALLVGSMFFGGIRGYSTLTISGMIFGGVVAFVGVMIGVVAVVRVYAKRKTQL